MNRIHTNQMSLRTLSEVTLSNLIGEVRVLGLLDFLARGPPLIFITLFLILGVVSCFLLIFCQLYLMLELKQPEPLLISSIFLTFGEWIR